MLEKRPENGKFGAKGFQCVLVGCSSESKAYRLYDSTARKIYISRDVKFLENPFDAENINLEQNLESESEARLAVKDVILDNKYATRWEESVALYGLRLDSSWRGIRDVSN